MKTVIFILVIKDVLYIFRYINIFTQMLKLPN